MVYNLEDLRKDYLAGKTYKYLFFWGHTPPGDGSVNQSCLSQWFIKPFEVDGVTYSCAEQYMMAGKARLFGDSQTLERILAAGHPKEMKALGRLVQRFDKTVWDRHCYDIVLAASKAKFSQNADLWDYLQGTTKRILVEASPRDRIWGIGMGKANPDAENPMKWRGTNLLGFALTQARDELLEQLKT